MAHLSQNLGFIFKVVVKHPWGERKNKSAESNNVANKIQSLDPNMKARIITHNSVQFYH